MLRRDSRAHSMTFWAMFIGLVMIPVMVLSMELGRYFYAVAEVQKAADAAAVAAAAEIDLVVFQETGALKPSSKTWSTAQNLISANTAGLSSRGVHAYVTRIQLSGSSNTVWVDVSANLSLFFPAYVPAVRVTRTGIASLRAFTH